jgi:hypothetical protein
MLDMVKLSVTNVSTSATAVATSRDESIPITGVIEAIYVDLSGAASPDIDIDITTVASNGEGAARTLWTKDDVTADVEKAVRYPTVTTADAAISNSVAKIPVAGKVRLDAYDANKASINVDAYIYFSSC